MKLLKTLAAAGIMALAATSACSKPVSGSAIAADPAEKPATIAEATQGPSSVTVWKTGDEDTTIYLMGTIHILNPEITWKNETIENAWEAADTVFFEADVTSPDAMNAAAALITQHGLNPPGVTLSSYFTEKERTQINEMLASLNITLEMLNPLRPWLAGVQVGNLAIASIGGSPESGIEMILSAEADKAAKTKRYFETLEEQITILADGDDKDQARLLLDGMKDLKDPEAFFAELIGAWYHGDDTALDALLVDAMDDAPNVAEALLFNRNKNWANQLDAVIRNEPGTFFVAVGAAHLVGGKSVQHQLSAHGYKTERLN
ncbi:MAG: TraB/GumN family protein [Parvularcula sp.]